MDLDLDESYEVVPEGVIIAPLHYLTIPHSQETRETLENSEDIHTIVKITETENGFDLKTFGEFKQVVSEHCFQTQELVGQKLCYLTTASWFRRGGEARCYHSSIKTISVTKCKEKCPHSEDALVAYVHCEGERKD